MSAIPECYNCYSAFKVIHTCSLNQKDDVGEKSWQCFSNTSSTEKNQLFLQTSEEIRQMLKDIAEHAITSHTYTLPKGYTLEHIVRDLIVLFVATGKLKKPGPNDPPIKFNAEKQTFWLCQRFIDQNREERSVEQSDR